jgi:hypothetical protein
MFSLGPSVTTTLEAVGGKLKRHCAARLGCLVLLSIYARDTR